MAKPVPHYGKWRIRFIDHNSKRKSAVYDDYKAAANALIEAKYKSLRIKQSGGPGLVEGKTFKDLCEYWLEHRAPQKRSGKADKSIIMRHLLPFLGVKKLSTITVQDVDLYKGAKLSLIHPKTIHNHLTLLISMLNVARELSWVSAEFKIKKPRCSTADSEFRYLRNSEQVCRFLGTALRENIRTYTLYATAIYTGMRAGELAGLQWSDVNFDSGLITVQRSFDGPTKSGRVRHVPILDDLVPILKTWRLQNPTPFVFINRNLSPLSPSDRIFQETLHRILRNAQFPKVSKSGKSVHYIRFHDLRHTFASHWVMGNGDIFKLQKILGHQSIQMTMRYAHLAPNAFKDDLKRVTFNNALNEGTLLKLR